MIIHILFTNFVEYLKSMSSRRCKCIANEWNIKEKHEVFLCIPECSLHYPNVQFLIEISKIPRRFLLTSIIFMATIEYRLSTKVQQDGRAEIMVRFFHGRSINQSTGTEIFALPSFFEYYIDRAKTEGMGIHVPFRVKTATRGEADKFGFALRNSGTLIVSNHRIRTPDVMTRMGVFSLS